MTQDSFNSPHEHSRIEFDSTGMGLKPVLNLFTVLSATGEEIEQVVPIPKSEQMTDPLYFDLLIAHFKHRPSKQILN